MKRRAASISSGESLQLMVDPMCNFFAGLVFLSVLAAVLSKNQSGSPRYEGEAGRTFANEELLDKRLAELREETRNLQNQNRTASKNTTETASLPSLEAVEKALAEAVGDAEGVGGRSVSEINARLEGALMRERDRLRSRFDVLGNELIALGKETVRLEGRRGILKEKTSSSGANDEVKVRLPISKKAKQNPLYIILSGGRCYPMQLPSGQEDETHVERERTPEEDRVHPRSNRGLTANEMEKFFRQIDCNQHYPVLVVYADSFGEYQKLRSMLEGMQQSYGWEPKAVGSPIRLTAQGFKPEVL
jgi:hypothetical protein